MRIGLAPLLAHLARRRGLALPAAILAAAALAAAPLAAPAQADTSSQLARAQPAAPDAALLGSSQVARPRAESPAHGPGLGSFQPLPNLPVNACNDSTLPRDYATNFPVPNDPSGFGFANQTVIGWKLNYLRSL